MQGVYGGQGVKNRGWTLVLFGGIIMVLVLLINNSWATTSEKYMADN